MRRAFTLIELLVVISIVTLLISLILPSIAKVRKSGRTTVCTNNMKQIGIMSSAYVNDYRERFATFSWKSGSPTARSEFPDLFSLVAGNETEVAIAQAVDLMRRRGDGTIASMPFPVDWQPYVMYTQLALLDYLDQNSLPASFICPEDRLRIDLQSLDRRGARESEIASARLGPHAYRYRFSGSYRQILAVSTRDAGTDVVVPSTSHNSYPSTQAKFRQRQLQDVHFPSQKVWFFDDQSRHDATQLWYADDRAKQPLLFFDGSVSVRATIDANVGFSPHRPNLPRFPRGSARDPVSMSQYAFRVGYDPSAAMNEFGRRGPYYPIYMYTRGGLQGIDFGGEELDTSLWTVTP